MGGRLFGPNPGLTGELCVLFVGIGLGDVVVAHDVDHGGDAAPSAAVGHGRATGRIEPLREGLHRRRDARPLDIAFDGPFLVAKRPEDHTGVVAVAPDHLLELAQLLGARAHQPVLIEDQHAETVASVEQLGRRRIV